MPHKKKYDVETTFRNYDLHGAAAAGNIGLVLYALRNGQPINAVLGGLLPLHAAASGGSAEVVQLLIDRGADVNAPRLPSNTGPPIGVGGAGSMVGPGGIIDDGHGTGTSMAGEKLHKGRAGSASGHAQPPVTPMARPGSSNTAQSLPIGRRGSTPLHFAAALGHADVIRILLENGANPTAKDVDKSTPEMVARAAGKRSIADFLKEWQATAGNTTEAVRRSFESPISTTSTQNPAIKTLGTASDLRLNAANNSTASLPLAASTPPASHSTSSLGRYPNSGRRPSLPSIYESPPSTSYPRPSSGKKPRSPERPATAASMHPPTSSALAKLPFTIRRPKSAGNRDGRSGDDASSQHSHASSKAQNSSTTTNTASRLNRIFKRPNLRPATASGALSTSPSPTSPSPPVITRSRSPSASRITDKDNSAHRSGGLFHGHHLPHLHRRDHGHPHPHHHHLHVSRDAISGPIMDGSRPSTSIPDISRPDLLDVGHHNSNSPAQPSPGTEKLSASPDEVDEDEAALYRTLNLTPAEIQYAKSRGALPDRLKSSARTAPAGQTSFGIGRKGSGSGLNRYPSHQGLSNKATTLPSPHIVPRHRAHLGPNGGMAMTSMEDQYQQGGGQEEYNRARAETPLSFGSTTMDRLSPAPHAARPVASYNSLRHEVDNRATEIRQQGDGAGSISSLGSHLSGSLLSNDHLRSPEATEDLTGDYISRPFKAPSVSTTHSPGGTSPSIASPGAIPFVDGRMISSRAQALELVEAQRRAIQTEHRERIRAKRLASASSHRTGASHLAEALAAEPSDGVGSSPTNGESEDDNASLDEDEVTALREQLAALGETAQIERRFARGEQQAKRWNRESGLDDASTEGYDDLDRGIAASLGASVLTRNEMLAGYLGQKELVDTERAKRPSTPKRDVFGRPVTPKKEGRPPTPKENRPATPKNPATPTASRIVDAPRENRILPPASKSQGRQPTQHLTLQQTRAISKSDLGLSSHFNKDDVAGRERAWTTTDVRPRVGPASATSRPSTAGAKPSASTNGGLTIDIIQTMPTPTDAGSSPLRRTPGTPGGDAQRESLQSRRRYNSNPLRIDAQAAQEKALTAKESPDEAPQPSPNVTSPKHQPRQQSNPKSSRKPSTPTKEQPAVLLHRITTTPPPAITLAPPTETPFGSFLSVSSNGGQGTPDRELPPTPVPALPSAVSLHNMHVARAREEAMKFMENPSLAQGSPPDSEMSAGNWNATAPSAAERRLGLGLGNQNGFGYESVRSFNEEKGGDRSYRLLGLDNRDSDTSTAGKSSRSKLGGLFSRLKR